MSELRVALVGYGMAGREFHAPLIRQVDGLRVSHVVTSNAERADTARAENPGVQVVATPTSCGQLTDEIDLVVLASPTGVHAAQAAEAVRRDTAVVVDKPFTVTAADAREVAALAASAGVLLTVFQNRRFYPDHTTAGRCWRPARSARSSATRPATSGGGRCRRSGGASSRPARKAVAC